MNAINNDPMLERIDSAFAMVRYAKAILREAQEGQKDADLYGCTMHQAEMALELAEKDFSAVGAR